jgi:transposase
MAYKPVNREMEILFPLAVNDYIPDNHLAKFIVRLVDRLDLSNFTSNYSGRGEDAYHPSVLLSLLLYSYIVGIFSSRDMERSTYDSIAVMYICNNEHPDHTTISEFRRKCLPELEGYFFQILEFASEAGIERIGNIYCDGSKVKANASKHKAYSYERAKAIKESLEKEIKILMAKGQNAEDSGNLILPETQIPEEIARRMTKLGRVNGAIEAIEERNAAEKEASAAHKAKQEGRGKDDDESDGNKPLVKTIPDVAASPPGPKAQINLTDPDSRIMPNGKKEFIQGYNAQICVDCKSRLIVEAHVSQKANDVQEIEPALNGLAKLPDSVGKATVLGADTGYYSEYNVELCLKNGIEPYFATGRDKHHKGLQERFGHPSELPDNASTKERMAHKLMTPEGKGVYSLRKSVVEPVFGIIKSAIGFDRFSLRRLWKVTREWTLAAVAYNLKRLHIIFKGELPSKATNVHDSLSLAG